MFISDKSLKLIQFYRGDTIIVLEIGAGEAVATIRYISESHRRQVKKYSFSFLKKFSEYNSCWLIRINPRDLKLSGYFGKTFHDDESRYIPIKETGLKALTEIKQELFKS